MVVKLIDFVAESRTQHARLKYNAFIAWFDQELIKCQMDLVVAELLFAAIDREVSFSLSQRGGLEFIYKRLVERGFIPPNGDEGISLIDSTVPQSDAQNLSAFNEFYKGLNTINQRILIGEVLLAIVMQAGALYAQQLKRGYQKNPVLEEYHLNQVIKDAAGHLLFPTATDIGASRKCKLTAQQEQSNLNPSV